MMERWDKGRGGEDKRRIGGEERKRCPKLVSALIGCPRGTCALRVVAHKWEVPLSIDWARSSEQATLAVSPDRGVHPLKSPDWGFLAVFLTDRSTYPIARSLLRMKPLFSTCMPPSKLLIPPQDHPQNRCPLQGLSLCAWTTNCTLPAR
jgi:hypothetical protein